MILLAARAAVEESTNGAEAALATSAATFSTVEDPILESVWRIGRFSSGSEKSSL
jgi:hypothetical protein